MLSRITTGIFVGTLIAAPAWAQSGVGQPANSPPPMNSSNSAGAGPQATKAAPGAQHTGSVRYITQDRPDLWRASKLEGVDVYNSDNQKIGDINDVLVDREGRVEAVVIGVGGFLGIGERNVAVPFNALQWQSHPGPTHPGTVAVQNPTPSTAPSSPDTHQTGNGSANKRAASRSTDRRDHPERAVLPNANKQQLENAPEFRYAS